MSAGWLILTGAIVGAIVSAILYELRRSVKQPEGGSPPADPFEGQHWRDPNSGIMYAWFNGSWLRYVSAPVDADEQELAKLRELLKLIRRNAL